MTRQPVRLTVERDVAVPMRDGTVLYAATGRKPPAATP